MKWTAVWAFQQGGSHECSLVKKQNVLAGSLMFWHLGEFEAEWITSSSAGYDLSQVKVNTEIWEEAEGEGFWDSFNCPLS